MNLMKILSVAAAVCVGASPLAVFADVSVSDRGDVSASEVFDVSSYEMPGTLTDSLRENLQKLSSHAGVICLKGDEDITDISSVGEDRINNAAVYIGAAEIESDGSVSAKFRLPSKSGRYTLCFVSPYYDNIYTSFDFESKLYFEYNDALVGGEDAVMTFLEDNLQFIPINDIGYSILNDAQKLEIAQYLIQQGEVDSENRFNELLSGLNIETRVFESCTADEINDYIRACRNAAKGSFDSVCTDVYFTKIPSDVRDTIIAEFVGKPFGAAQLDDFRYRVLCAYTDTFDNFAMMQSIADDGEQWGIFSATLEKYRGLNDKNSVLLSAFSSVHSSESLDGFARNFAALVDEKYNAEHSGASSSSPSGGGGGGGGRGSSVSVAPSAEAVYQPPKGDDENSQHSETVFGDMDDFAWAKSAVEKLAECGIVSGKAEGIFAPSDAVTREEFVKLITTSIGLTGVEYESSFDDVSADDWFAPSVAAAVRSGFISGVSLKAFGTGQNITRQDAAVIMHRIYVARGYRINSATNDLPNDIESVSDYAADAVTKLFSMGIINGYDDGDFRPHGTLTRAEAAVIILRFFSSAGIIN